MRLLDQRAMQQLFAVTDEVPVDREALEVPLERTGPGAVERLPGGSVRITLPETDEDLESFLAALPGRLGDDAGSGGREPGST